jgi:hypothetical protein
MNNPSSVSPAWLPLGLLIGTTAIAQAPAAPQPPVARRDANGSGPLYDPDQLPSFSGKVEQFTLSPRGEIDGLILSDGTEVKTAPHLSTSIAYSIKPGDTVTIHGLRAAAIPLLQATAITDHVSGRTIIDTGPGRLSPRQLADIEGAAMVEVQGSVRMSLHGGRGEINGVLLSDGTILRLPPDAASNIDTLLQPGRKVIAQGDELVNPIGKVLEVRAMGASRAELVPVDGPPPPGPGDRGRPPRPRPDAPPPPPGPGQ